MDIVTYILATKGTEDLVDELVAKGFEFSTSSSLILISDSEQSFIDKIQIEEERISEFGDYFYDKISSWNEETECLINLKLPPTYDINLIKLEELEDKADGIENEVSGDGLVNVNDSDELSLKRLRLFGKTTQDGTPTPDNPIEFVSTGDSGTIETVVCGKNLLDISNGIGIGGNDKITIDGDTITMAAGTQLFGVSFLDGIEALKAGNEYFYSFTELSGHGTSYGLLIVYQDGTVSNLMASHCSFVIEKPIRQVSFYFSFGETFTEDVILKGLQIEAGNKATPYEPFKGMQTFSIAMPDGLRGIPVTSGGNYTDENGQAWICDELDLEKGVYIKRTEKKSFTLTKREYATSPLGYRYTAFATLGSDFCLCEQLPYNANAATHLITTDGIRCAAQYGTIAAQYTDTAGDTQTLAVDVLYVLANPIEAPLTSEQIEAIKALHTYYPSTIVTNNGGAGMKIKYTADTKHYIDNKFAEIQDLILQGG